MQFFGGIFFDGNVLNRYWSHSSFRFWGIFNRIYIETNKESKTTWTTDLFHDNSANCFHPINFHAYSFLFSVFQKSFFYTNENSIFCLQKFADLLNFGVWIVFQNQFILALFNCSLFPFKYEKMLNKIER